MDNKGNNRRILPPQFAHLEQPLKDAQAKLKEIDEQIDRVPKDKGPQPSFRPPGYGGPSKVVTDSRYKSFERLEREKELTRLEFQKLAEKDIKALDPKSAKDLKETLDFHLSDNKFAKMDSKELNQAHSELKGDREGIDASQDYMFKTRSDFKASDRFFKNSNFNKGLEKAESLNSKTPEPEKGIEPEKD